MECTNKENKMTEKAMESQFASDLESDDLDRNNNSKGGGSKSKSKSNAKNGKNYEKYSLRPRSIQNRIETEKRQTEVKKKPKPKQKPPPLSKYRRKTANARERGRMREINEAFDCLQRAVPQYPILPVNAQGKTCEKLTKITTLRLAMNYIEALAQLLNNPPVVCGSESGNSTDIESYSSPSSSSVISGNFSSSSSDFSPASSFAMSPLSMSMSCSPAPDCLQTVMRSVVSPASAAATAAAAAATAAALNINSNTNTINRTHVNILNNNTTSIPNHHQHHHRISEQHRISNSNSTIVNLNQPNLNFNAHSQNQNLTSVVTALPVNLIDDNNLLLSGSNLVSQSPPGMLSALSPIPVVPSFSPPMPLLLSPSSICSSSPTSSSACSPKIFSNNNMNKITTKLPPISSSLSSALLKRSMSSFIADCAHMTGVINNNGHRTGSLSSLTESDLSEYASDLLSDEGSTLDDPMFDDLIGVNVATDLELLLESDGDSLHFSSDLSDT